MKQRRWRETVVFLGPSLSLEEARAALPADYRPPAKRGDIAAVVAQGVARRVVLIDGLFHGSPSVWQRELVAALRSGIEVFGASSMGALRAAEVERYGMIGHGVIFKWYVDGLISGDDEVALLHAGEESGWRALSEPMVNVRATVLRCQRRGLITPEEGQALLTEAKATFYPSRSLAQLTSGAAAASWSETKRQRFLANRCDQKRRDARSLLAFCARTPVARSLATAASRRITRASQRVVGIEPELVAQPHPSATPAMARRTTYVRGTHRVMSAEQTLARIAPILPTWGITRLADITGLDTLGIPTSCSIRPTAKTLQVSNGKGLRKIDADVSALMEALELAHLEASPEPQLLWASAEEMGARGEPFGVALPEVIRVDGQLEWVRGDELMTASSVWLPASLAWLRPVSLANVTSHGLASGNTLVEATLHALYEVLERHVLSELIHDHQLDLAHAQTFAADQSANRAVRLLAARIAASGVKLVLLRVDSRIGLHVFMAVLLDPDSLGGASIVNVGYGAHLSPSVAATRAITEAAQCRLTYIHGAREDLRPDSYQRSAVHERLYAFFDACAPDTNWSRLKDRSSNSCEVDLARVLKTMKANALPQVFRIDMSRAGMPFAVTKVIVPGSTMTIPV